MSPTLVTKDALAGLNRSGIRYELVGSDLEHTTLRFDHQALDELAAEVRAGDRGYVNDLRGERASLNDQMQQAKADLAAYQRVTGMSLAEVRDASAG